MNLEIREIRGPIRQSQDTHGMQNLGNSTQAFEVKGSGVSSSTSASLSDANLMLLEVCDFRSCFDKCVLVERSNAFHAKHIEWNVEGKLARHDSVACSRRQVTVRA